MDAREQLTRTQETRDDAHVYARPREVMVVGHGCTPPTVARHGAQASAETLPAALAVGPSTAAPTATTRSSAIATLRMKHQPEQGSPFMPTIPSET